MRTSLLALAAISTQVAIAYECPPLGSPATLTDWRWLARPPVGKRHVLSDPWGKQKLPSVAGGFLALDVSGPGVLDHLWASTATRALLTIEVDGERLWRGPFGVPVLGEDRAPLFPKPLRFSAAGMDHLLAPIGFRQRLRLLVDKASFRHLVSYRTLPQGTPVLPASAANRRAWERAAELWRKQGHGIRAQAPLHAQALRSDFVLSASSRTTAFEQDGSGEITGIEFHMSPALTGTLREVVVEVCCDGANAPALRLPITDLVGLPHPWPCGRWDQHSGTLAASLRYPWHVHKPRYYFPEATFHLNLPIPFARGIRIELVNRSDRVQFVGHARVIVEPLPEAEAIQAGRLCGTTTHRPVQIGTDPRSLIVVPGPGQLVGLGLFMTGNAYRPPAMKDGVVALTVDGAKPITGHGILPLWFQGIYGGPVTNQAIWNHPRLSNGYVGAMRHFLTDPIPFEQEADVAYTPGPEAQGAPTQAIAIALWYRFGQRPYEAPALPDRAEWLPHSAYGDRPALLGSKRQKARMAWSMEAEDLAAMATAHGVTARVVEDRDHNYHPSRGKYLHVVGDQAGGHVDCVVRFPHAPYVAVGFDPLWGPGRARFELDLLSREAAKTPPAFAQSGAHVSGRATGSVPMKAPIFCAERLCLRRDPEYLHSTPIRNPAPDQVGVLRMICQSKSFTSSIYLMKLDRVRMDLPPQTEAGWREFESLAAPRASGGLSATVPKYGSFDWSGWGALLLASPASGRAVLTALSLTGPAEPSAVRIRGSLGPDQGSWQAQIAGSQEPITLTPGKDAREVVEWSIPATGVKIPGLVELEITCLASGQTTRRMALPPRAELALDAWTLE